MKQAKRKEHLKKIMFIQHICIWALLLVGLGFVITKTLAREWVDTRDTNRYIDDTFWNKNPTTGDIFDALYSGTTIYTKNMSWYTQCNKLNTNIIELTWDNTSIKVLPQTITDNTIYILSGWTYTVINKMTLSGNCIAFIGRWSDVNFGWIIDTTNAKYTIIDNISYHNHLINNPQYTTTTWINISLENLQTTNINYIITWDISEELTGTILPDDMIIEDIILSKDNDENQTDITFYDTYNVLNHSIKKIIHDDQAPTITWMKDGSIITEWLYNTWISIEISDENLSWIYNNWSFLWSDNNYYNIFTTEGLYNIIAIDKAWNQNEISFEIDTTAPTVNNLQPSSWSTYTGTNLLLSWNTQENSARIASQTYYLYSWSITISSWNITPWNTWVSLVNINKWFYNRKVVIKDTAGNITTWSVPSFYFSKIPSIFTGSNGYNKWWLLYTNTNPIIIFSGNKTFSYNIYTWSTWDNFVMSWDYTTIGTNKQETIVWNGWNTGDLKIHFSYTTQDNETGTYIFNFVIDKTIPSITLTPLWWRVNTTWDIEYNRSTTNKTTDMIKYYNFRINNTLVYSGSMTSYTKTGIEVDHEYKAQTCAYDIAWNSWCSPIQNRIIDQTAPVIHNVINNSFYKYVPNPIPVITDENNENIFVTIQKNWIIISSWNQSSPYGVPLQQGEANYTITASDTAGNIATTSFVIDTTPPVTYLVSPENNTTFTDNNSVNFTWNTNEWYLSWYKIIISGNSYGVFYTGILTNNPNLTINNLNNGVYQRWIESYDKAWNKTITDRYNFTIQVPLNGTIELSWAKIIWYTTYVNSYEIDIITNINKPTIATITGDIVSSYGYQTINKDIPAWLQTTTINITPNEGIKNVYINLQDYIGWTNIYSKKTFTVDNIPPTKPVLTNINNQTYTGSFILNRPESSDQWAGVKEYNYEIYNWSQVVKSWTWLTTSIALGNMEIGSNWIYSIKVKVIDYIGNSSDRSVPAIFTYNGIEDTSPDNFSFSRQYDVRRERIYRSNTVTIQWLSTGTAVKAILDEWDLYVNNINVGEQALVRNDDVLFIELESSDEYDDIKTSTLTINDKSSTFKLITEVDPDDEDDNDELSDDEIEELEETYELISQLDYNLRVKFKDMLQDKIDELENDGEDEKEIEKLRYIYDLLVDDLDNDEDIIYTAPNNKTYIITYVSGKWYTSINFSKTNQSKYFTTMDEITAFIDKYNKSTWLHYTIDTTRSTSSYTAPNGKVYNLFKTTANQYSAYNMVIPKLFNSLEELKNYIKINNPRR